MGGRPRGWLPQEYLCPREGSREEAGRWPPRVAPRLGGGDDSPYRLALGRDAAVLERLVERAFGTTGQRQVNRTRRGGASRGRRRGGRPDGTARDRGGRPPRL